MAKITDQPTLSIPSPSDILHIVDVSDTTSSPEGTSKQITLASLGNPFISQKTTLINKLSDFPAPIANVITLASETEYFIGNSVDLGENRLVMGENTAVNGVDSIIVTLTYTGTGDMFTIVNTRNRIRDLTLLASTGRVINFSDNTDSVFKMDDVNIVCATFGLFNSSGIKGSTVRFTSVSPSTITVTGAKTTGNWNTWLWETSNTNLTSGTMFDFGTATFNEIVLDLIMADLEVGTTLIKGLVSSGNIKTGGIGTVNRMLTEGAGTPLSGITIDDFRWDFQNNNNIPNTAPDAMVSLNSNAVETDIIAIGTPVKVEGIWVVERTSHFLADATGRITYISERDITVPIDITTIVKSASGENKNITVFLALNGTVISNSRKTNRVGQNDPKSVPVLWQLTLTKNDFLEVFVQNDSDTVNLIVDSAIQRVQ